MDAWFWDSHCQKCWVASMFLLCVKQQPEHRPKEPVFLMVKIHMMHILPQASRNHVHLIK